MLWTFSEESVVFKSILCSVFFCNVSSRWQGTTCTTCFAIQRVGVGSLSPSSVVGLPQKQQRSAPLPAVSLATCSYWKQALKWYWVSTAKHFREISLAGHSKLFLRLSVARWLLVPRRGSLWAAAVCCQQDEEAVVSHLPGAPVLCSILASLPQLC